MLLNIDDSTEIKSPRDKEIATHLEELKDEQFAVLSKKDEIFVQCYRNEADDFDLEYREGSANAHFRIENAEQATVLAAFSAFQAGTFKSWKTSFQWEKVEFDEDFEGDDFLTHWIIEGKEYPRVRVGKDEHALACPTCRALAKDYHSESCGLEKCPRCGEKVKTCGCASSLN